MNIITVKKMAALIVQTASIFCVLMSTLYAINDFASHIRLSDDKYFIFFSKLPRLIVVRMLIELIIKLLFYV